MNTRIGIGFDSHRFDVNRPLILGGIRITDSNGLQGHSDADVLTHAIIDALLGAASLGDIGTHFPPGEAKWSGIDSQNLLTRTVSLLTKHGYRVGNVDSTIIAEEPRLGDHILAIQARIALTMGIAKELVSVKATSPEGMGALGRSEGIAVQAVAQIVSQHDC